MLSIEIYVVVFAFWWHYC